MAVLVSAATGNFTAAGSWGLGDSTSFLDSEAASTATTTSYVLSSTFTPGAITIDGIAVKILSRVASPAGTFSVALDQATVTVSGTEVAINVSDIHVNGRGWIFIKFGSPVTLAAATAYSVKVKSSTNAEVTMYRNATAGNWSRVLRTTTTQAPASGDQLIIVGDLTGAGTGNDITITMNNTATTSFGAAAQTQSISICRRGILSSGVAASTAYILKWRGTLDVFAGGLANLGTSGTPIPSTSSLDFQMDVGSNGDTGIFVHPGGTMGIYGATKTTLSTRLTVNLAAAGTVVTVGSTSDWATGDELGFAGTLQDRTKIDKKSILTVDSGVQVTLSAGVTNAHLGTAPTQGHVINLTRNVKIHGVSTSLQGYLTVETGGVLTARYAEFYFLGVNSTNKHGIECQTTTGSCDIQFCSVHDFGTSGAAGVIGFYINTTSSSTAITFSNNVMYNCAQNAIASEAATSASIVLNANTMIGTTVGTTPGMCRFKHTNIQFSTNVLSSFAFLGLWLEPGATITSLDGNEIYCGESLGFYLNNSQQGMTIGTLTVWRCGNASLSGGVEFAGAAHFLTCNNWVLFGNGGEANEFNLKVSVNIIGVTFNACSLAADTTVITVNGILFSGTALICVDWLLDGCDFGVVSGIKRTHNTNDINLNGAGYIQIVTRNTILNSSTPVVGVTTSIKGSFVKNSQYQQTVATQKSFFVYGNVELDTAFFKAASPSERLTPSNASNKLVSGPKKAAVGSGGTITFSVWVRKSAAGDGAAYNGAQPRLRVRSNSASGIAADATLATAAAATGTWEQLSGTTAAVTDDAVLEAYLDCDGTAGWVNDDDWRAV